MTENNSPLERLLDWCAGEVASLRLSHKIPSTDEIDDDEVRQEIEQVEADIAALSAEDSSGVDEPGSDAGRPILERPEQRIERALLRLSNRAKRGTTNPEIRSLIDRDREDLRRALSRPAVPESVRSLPADFRRHATDLRRAAHPEKARQMEVAADKAERAIAQHSEPGRGETCPVCEKGTLTRVECCICDNCDATPVLTDQICRNDKRLAARSGRIPEGWKLVPVEPTEAMLDAFIDEWEDIRGGSSWDAYCKMLAAAPAPDADERE